MSNEGSGSPDDMLTTDHLSAATVAAFIGGDLSPDEQLLVEAHLDECERCRRELMEVGELEASFHEATAARRTRSWPFRWGAAGMMAAALAGLILVRPTRSSLVPMRLVPSASAPEVAQRARVVFEGRARIDVVHPALDDASFSDTLHFVWHSSGADVYRFTLLDESGAPLATSETVDTTVAWPASVSAIRGRAYFWRVDGISRGIVASTGARHLHFAP